MVGIDPIELIVTKEGRRGGPKQLILRRQKQGPKKK
jgi:hypothetical protein